MADQDNQEQSKVEVIMMSNQEKFIQSYTDLIDILYDLTGAMQEQKDYEKMLPDIEMLDQLTTNLKRMGDTVVLNSIEEIEKLEKKSIKEVDNKEGETK